MVGKNNWKTETYLHILFLTYKIWFNRQLKEEYISEIMLTL